MTSKEDVSRDRSSFKFLKPYSTKTLFVLTVEWELGNYRKDCWDFQHGNC